jgi:hypothetical protein
MGVDPRYWTSVPWIRASYGGYEVTVRISDWRHPSSLQEWTSDWERLRGTYLSRESDAVLYKFVPAPLVIDT